MTYKEDFDWTMKLIDKDVIPAIDKVFNNSCNTLTIQKGDEEEDMTQCTDLKILNYERVFNSGRFMSASKVRIAVRIRTFEYFERFKDQITIRLTRTYNTTEHEKILSGWGDYLFYGFASENKQSLIHWNILNLHLYREYCKLRLQKSRNLGFEIKNNSDDSSDFYVIPISFIEQYMRNIKYEEINNTINFRIAQSYELQTNNL